MDLSKDGKSLIFSDDEINTNVGNEKQVFVTKRINGKESHVKVSSKKNHEDDEIYFVKKNKKITPSKRFDFDDEIVIGMKKDNPKNHKNKKDKKSKQKQEYKIEKFRKEKNKKKTIEKVNKSENRNVSQRSKNKRRKVSIAPKIFILIFLIIVIALFMFMAPIFNITNINVSGNEIVSSEEIINLSGIQFGNSIFEYGKKAKSGIKQNCYIECVEIKRSLPGTVNIIVQERSVKYQIALINGFVYVDKNGYLLEVNAEKKSVPILTGLATTEDELLNNERLSEKDLEYINSINKIIDSAKSADISNKVSEINVKSKNEFILKIETENKEIYIGDTSNLTNKMLYIKKILENESGKSGIIFVNGDLNSGFNPYFREQ